MATATPNRFIALNYLWLFLIPLSYNFWGLDPALHHKFLLIDVSLLLVALMLVIGKSVQYTISRAAIVFVTLYGISALLALPSLLLYKVNEADGWFIWLHLVEFPVFVILLLLTRLGTNTMHKMFSQIIAWFAFAALVIAAGQYIIQINTNGLSFISSDSIKASFAHKNIFAEVIFLTIPFTCYAFIVTRKKIYGAIVAFALVMIGLSFSRAVIFALFASGLITVIVYLRANRKSNIKARRIWFGIGASIFVLSLAYFILRFTPIGNPIFFYYHHRDTVNERIILWRATWQLIQSHPFFGWGLGSWKVVSMQYAMLGLRNYITFFQQPHNDLLWILSEQGLVSFLFLASAWIFLLIKLVSGIFKKPSEAFNYCLLIALLGYFVYSNFGFPRERAEHGIFLAYIAAFILNDNQKPAITFSGKYLIFCIPLLTAAAWWAGAKMMGDINMRKALICRDNSEYEEELSYLNKIGPRYYSLDGTATPVAWYKGMVHFVQQNNELARNDFREAVNANPYHAYSLTNLGTCIAAAGDKDESEHYFKQALLYSPGFPDAALNICALKYNKGQTDSAAFYLNLANDSIADLRYAKFLNTLTSAFLKPVIDSAQRWSDTSLLENCQSLQNKPEWQLAIIKKANKYKRPVQQQIWMDIIWVLKYQEKKQELGNKYQTLLHLPPI
jgi:O-antigen ligase